SPSCAHAQKKRSARSSTSADSTTRCCSTARCHWTCWSARSIAGSRRKNRNQERQGDNTMKRMAYAFAAALVAGCTTAPAERPGTQAGQLEQVVESYFDATLEMNPVIATFIGDHRFNDQLPNMLDEEFLDRAAALERDYLERIRDIDASKLE